MIQKKTPVTKKEFTPKYSTDSAKKIMEQLARREKEKGESY